MSEGVRGGSPQTKAKSCCFGLLLEVSEPESTSFSKVGAHVDFERFDAVYPSALAVRHALAAKTSSCPGSPRLSPQLSRPQRREGEL